MNERIKELSIRAGFPEWSDHAIEFELEQFAELIVKECAEVITETRWHLPPTQQQIAVGIKEHFGVNE